MKVGSKYRTRAGEVITITEQDYTDADFPYHGSNGVWYTADGRFDPEHNNPQGVDVVEEIDSRRERDADQREAGVKLQVGGVYQDAAGQGVYIDFVEGHSGGQFYRGDNGGWYYEDGKPTSNVWQVAPLISEVVIRDPAVREEPSRALKNDVKDGKVGRSYIHPATLDAMQLAMDAGAIKYDSLNFMKGHAYTQLLSAAMRHLEASLWKGDLDEDCTQRLGRDVLHLGCALACINMLLAQREAGTLTDDRELDKRNPNA